MSKDAIIDFESDNGTDLMKEFINNDTKRLDEYWQFVEEAYHNMMADYADHLRDYRRDLGV